MNLPPVAREPLQKTPQLIRILCVGAISLAILLVSACGNAQSLSPAPQASPTTTLESTTSTPTSARATREILSTRSPATPSPTRKPDTDPTTTATATQPACLQQGGYFEYESIRSSLLKLPMEVRVYVPACHKERNDQRFPVLYLIHGQSYTEDQWDRLGADEALDELVSSGEVTPFIIVMPRDRLWVDPVESNFGQVFIEELIPWVDRTYRTIADRQHRAVGGLSRGAAWALHLGLSRWELFGSIGAHSSPIFFSDASKLRRWLREIPKEQLPRIYLDIGDRDYLNESNEWLKKVLDDENVPHEYYLFPGYHEETYWSAHIEQYLVWYAQEW